MKYYRDNFFRFRYDYVNELNPREYPGFHRFLRDGVRAKWMNSVFPADSLPAWTTLLTGLWPEAHGIVGNNFYDSAEHEFFQFNNFFSVTKKKVRKFV